MKLVITLFTIFISSLSYGQSILGQWETFDDETNEKKAIVEIYNVNNLYFAKIVESYESEKNAVCETCKGYRKGEPIIGLIIIENLKQEDNEYKGGTIMDPENGKTYKCTVELINKNELKVRGYIGFSLLGRTQYWSRSKVITN